MGGTKHDADKPDMSMVSRELMEAVARVRMFGAKKYSRDNWKKGFKVTRSVSASLRHIFAFLSGEDNDPESGLCHLWHAVCGLEHAIYDLANHPANDDRKEAEPELVQHQPGAVKIYGPTTGPDKENDDEPTDSQRKANWLAP